MPSAPRFRLKQLAGICRRIGISLDAGVDARKAWSREAERATGRYGRALQHIADEISSGSSLPDAIDGTDDAFPPLLHDLVRIGQQTGKLDQVFLRLAEHFEHLMKLRRIFLTGITWPAIQLSMAIGIVGLLILVMGMIPAGPDGPLDLLGLGLMGPQGLLIYLMYLLAFFVVAAVLIENWRHGRWGGVQIVSFLYRLPILGNCLQTMSLGRMAWTLSLTTNTPMDVKTSLQSALRSTASPIYTRLQDEVTESLKSGIPIHSALRQTQEFPDEFLDAIEVGEETGQLSESLYRLSQQYEQRAQAAAKTLTIVGSFLVWGFVACIIIAIIFRLALFYTGLITEMSQPGWI